MAGPCWKTPLQLIRSVLAPAEVQLDLFQRLRSRPAATPVPGGGNRVASETVVVGDTSIEVQFVRHPRARDNKRSQPSVGDTENRSGTRPC